MSELIHVTIEDAAQKIYQTWAAAPGYVPWVANGNSRWQDDARRLANKIIAPLHARIAELEDTCLEWDRLCNEVKKERDAENERLTKERDEWQCWALRNDRELHAVSVAIGSVRFMDPPDGGDVSLAEQVSRQGAALESAERQNAALVEALRKIENHPEEYNSKRGVSFGVRWAFNNARAIARDAIAQLDAPQLDTRDASAQRRVNVLRGALEVVRCQCSMLCAPDDPFNKGVLATIDAALSFPDVPRPDATSYTPIESFNELWAYLEAVGAQPDARDAALAEAVEIMWRFQAVADRESSLRREEKRQLHEAGDHQGQSGEDSNVSSYAVQCGECHHGADPEV
jgi:hypothetical protein